MKFAKKYLPAGLLIAFMLFFFAANLITPDRDFSEKENRELAAAPKFSFKSLFSGDFTADFESYITDQFFERDFWVSMKAKCELLLGKDEINGVLVGDNGLLVAQYPQPDLSRLEANASAVETFAQNAGIPVYFTLIPGAAEIWSDRLPDTGRSGSQADAIAYVCGRVPSAVKIDTLAALSAHSGEDIYYYTDHHWTTLGAYYGYSALAEAMGLVPSALPEAFEEVSGFYGTASSACGLSPAGGDTVSLRVPEEAASFVRVYNGREWKDGTLYSLDKLSVRDKYTVFLNGNEPLTVIGGSNPDGEKLLLVKDSYANCEIPYLCGHFSEIHVVDLRYYKQSISEYIEKNGIDAAVVSYSVSNFSEDTNLFFLTK